MKNRSKLPSLPILLTLSTDPIANQRINLMTIRTETPQLHLLRILDLLRIAIPPLHWYLAIRIRIHQHIKRAIAIQLRQKRHAGRDLAEHRLDLGLQLDFGLLGRRSRGVVGDGVLFVGGSFG